MAAKPRAKLATANCVEPQSPKIIAKRTMPTWPPSAGIAHPTGQTRSATASIPTLRAISAIRPRPAVARQHLCRMPRDSALTLSDVRGPSLAIVCQSCARYRRYGVARLIEEHGDAKLTELIVTLADLSEGELRTHV